MELVQIKTTDKELKGVIMLQTSDALVAVLSDGRSAMIPLPVIQSIQSVRKLTPKEEIEVEDLLKTSRKIGKSYQKMLELKKSFQSINNQFNTLQKEIGELIKFSTDQAEYIGHLINVDFSPVKKPLSLDDIDEELTAVGYRSLKTLIDDGSLSLDEHQVFHFYDMFGKELPASECPTKEQFLVVLHEFVPEVSALLQEKNGEIPS